MKIPRFCFNFRHKCNMRCPYCYIPFVDKEAGTLELWKKLVDRMMAFSPELITFGGGDPFAYPDFPALIDYCRQFDVKIHVDTNCIGLTRETLADIGAHIAMLGIPLDGDEEYHNSTRRYNRHYQTLMASLDRATVQKVPMRINTVYYPDYKQQLYHVANVIRQHKNVQQWFIYEYWHFKNINAAEIYDYSIFDFEKEYPVLRELSGIGNIHFSPVSERVGAYLFISSCGCLYTVSSEGDQYIELGNLLEKTDDEIYRMVTNIDKISNRTQLKIKVSGC